MEPENRPLLLFEVSGKEHNPDVNLLKTYGGTSGGVSDFKKLTPGFDRSDAVERVKAGMETALRDYEAEVAKGEQSEYHRFHLPLLHPGAPRQVESWTAQEIKIEGYRIRVEQC